MNQDAKHLLGAVALGALSAALGVGLLAWPAWREHATIRRETGSLRTRMAASSATTEIEARLRLRLAEERDAVARECREIPADPGTADLMRRLSLPVDGQTVVDQTFTVGTPSPAMPGSEGSEMVMPLTVDLVGSFDSAFALLRAAERMGRLVRVSSLHVSLSGGTAARQETSPLLAASIGLEVAYLADAGKEPMP